MPYRNSKVTSVLRDSLGGNCKTSMIATVNLDDDFSMESISTCKFAARYYLYIIKLGYLLTFSLLFSQGCYDC